MRGDAEDMRGGGSGGLVSGMEGCFLGSHIRPHSSVSERREALQEKSAHWVNSIQPQTADRCQNVNKHSKKTPNQTLSTLQCLFVIWGVIVWKADCSVCNFWAQTCQRLKEKDLLSVTSCFGGRLTSSCSVDLCTLNAPRTIMLFWKLDRTAASERLFVCVLFFESASQMHGNKRSLPLT